MPGTRAAAACALTEALNILDLEDYDGETVRLDRAGEMTGFRYLGTVVTAWFCYRMTVWSTKSATVRTETR